MLLHSSKCEDWISHCMEATLYIFMARTAASQTKVEPKYIGIFSIWRLEAQIQPQILLYHYHNQFVMLIYFRMNDLNLGFPPLLNLPCLICDFLPFPV